MLVSPGLITAACAGSLAEARVEGDEDDSWTVASEVGNCAVVGDLNVHVLVCCTLCEVLQLVEYDAPGEDR